MKLTTTVEGLRECEEALLDIGRTAKNVLKRALVKAAAPIEAAAEAAAPKRKGRLARSVVTGTTLNKNQRKRRTKQGVAEVFVGSTSPLAHLQEFGAAHHGPHAFMRPAFDANAEKALKIFRDELKVEIDKAKQRAARKAARLLAKSRG